MKPKIIGLDKMDIPLLVVTPHSSSYVPEKVKPWFALSGDEVNKFTDAGIEDLLKPVELQGGVLIPGSVSRFVVQLNRKKDMDNIILRKSWKGRYVWKRALNEKQKNHIIREYHDPFFEAIDGAVAEIQEKFGYSILICAFAYNSISAKWKRKHEDFILGTRYGGTASENLIDITLRSLLIGRKINVDSHGLNGGYITGHYSRLADPEEMMPKGINPETAESLQIGVRKGSYVHETSFNRHRGFWDVQKQIDWLVRNIADYARQKDELIRRIAEYRQ